MWYEATQDCSLDDCQIHPPPFFCPLSQGFSESSCLSQNSLSRPGWCHEDVPASEMKVLCHHCLVQISFYLHSSLKNAFYKNGLFFPSRVLMKNYCLNIWILLHEFFQFGYFICLKSLLSPVIHRKCKRSSAVFISLKARSFISLNFKLKTMRFGNFLWELISICLVLFSYRKNSFIHKCIWDVLDLSDSINFPLPPDLSKPDWYCIWLEDNLKRLQMWASNLNS